ncbi:MAG: hypothetical protein H0V70_04210, partial [Ktedonobacteraceae bacterium]|nr:hypothetical protein [Ktedonobacteraceae bacterium]
AATAAQAPLTPKPGLRSAEGAEELELEPWGQYSRSDERKQATIVGAYWDGTIAPTDWKALIFDDKCCKSGGVPGYTVSINILDT